MQTATHGPPPARAFQLKAGKHAAGVVLASVQAGDRYMEYCVRPSNRFGLVEGCPVSFRFAYPMFVVVS